MCLPLYKAPIVDCTKVTSVAQPKHFEVKTSFSVSSHLFWFEHVGLQACSNLLGCLSQIQQTDRDGEHAHTKRMVIRWNKWLLCEAAIW
jgi:hypothetical protein